MFMFVNVFLVMSSPAGTSRTCPGETSSFSVSVTASIRSETGSEEQKHAAPPNSVDDFKDPAL